MSKLESPVTTITGTGNVIGEAILSEIGNVTKFDSLRKLIAFAGLDTTITQSGEFEAVYNMMHITVLRKAIFQAPVLSVYYQKKGVEGKHYFLLV